MEHSQVRLGPSTALKFILAVALLAGLQFVSAAAQAAQAYEGPHGSVRVHITQVAPSQQPFCDVHDYYMHITIDGNRSARLDPELPFEHKEACISAPPQLEFRDVEAPVFFDKNRHCGGNVEVGFEFYERDGEFPDFTDDLELYETFTFSGSESDCYWPDDGKNGGFCWEVEFIDPAETDSDGDGLADVWEIYGIDRDCDGWLTEGTEDLFLHEMGADPNHKDLFVELNWFTSASGDGTSYIPPASTLHELIVAFGSAPKNAAGVLNPDGQNGIRVHFDAGHLVGMGEHSRGGRNLGPENNPAIWGSDALRAFIATQSDRARRGVFHEVYFGPVLLPNGEKDERVSGKSLGLGKIILEQTDAIALMHELGHSMGLKHGGEDRSWNGYPRVGRNCKPNHLSVMNYAYAAGIPYANGGDPIAGGSITNYYADFSPSKFPNALVRVHSSLTTQCPMNVTIPGDPDAPWGCNVRMGLLPSMNEASLDELMVLATSDLSQQRVINQAFTYTDSTGFEFNRRVASVYPFDFDGSGDSVAPSRSVRANIDVRPLYSNGDQGCTAEDPDTGEPLNSTFDVLENLDEWSAIRIAPRASVEGSCYHPSADEIAARRRELARSDLAIAGTFSPSPIYSGSLGTLRLEVETLSRSLVSGGRVEVVLPAGVTALQTPPGCARSSPSSYVCGVANPTNGEALEPGQLRTIAFTVRVESHTSGQPRSISAFVSHDGPDPSWLNNSVVVPVPTLPGFLSFEDELRPWVRSWGVEPPLTLTTSISTTGQHALALSCGFTQFETPTFDTAELEAVGSIFTADILVPSAQTDPWWLGDIALSLDVPSAGLSGHVLGSVSLATLPRGTWARLEFDLTDLAIDTLLGDHPDARFRFAANVASCTTPLLLDSFGFEGDVITRTDFHGGPAESGALASSSVLTFDEASAWMSSGAVALTQERTQGAAALELASAPWTELKSRAFPAADLSPSSRLGLDVFVPELPADYHWYGNLSLFASCPSAGLGTAFLGGHSLHILFDGEFNRLDFDVPTSVLDAFESDADDCHFEIKIVSDAAFAPLIIDNGGFYLE